MERQKTHTVFCYSVIRGKTQTEGMFPKAKTPVNLDNEVTRSLLQCDLIRPRGDEGGESMQAVQKTGKDRFPDRTDP
ncbi:MAG: hypothetical protein WCY59_04130 [Anaerovoracaceae bacterium]